MDKSKESQPGSNKNPSGNQSQSQTPAEQKHQSPQQPQQHQPQKEQTQHQQQGQHEKQAEPGDVPVQEPSDQPAPPITNGKNAAASSANAGSAPIAAQSQQPKAADGDAAKWQQQVGAARTTWGKLTEDELVKSGGHEQKLASLVQGRYAISHDEASRQVKKFIATSHAR
ncbi:MAG: hypothetical protein Q8J78_09005 [Moraxellaceae bacterium]|nr:hypothetical protein [Moraxellaceae bacterium]